MIIQGKMISTNLFFVLQICFVWGFFGSDLFNYVTVSYGTIFNNFVRIQKVYFIKQFWNIKNDFSRPVIKMHMNIHVHGKSHITVTSTQVTEALFLKGTRIKDGIFQFSANIQGF